MEKFSWSSDQGRSKLLDHLMDGIFVVDGGVLVYANQPLARMLGRQIDSLTGSAFIDIVADYHRPLVLDRYVARLSGKTVPEQYEIDLLTGEGEIICCSLNVGLISDVGDRVVTAGTVRDITRQKRELAELAESRTELQSIFDQLPDVFYRTDMQGIITMISPACFDTIGYRQEEMLGMPMSSYYFTPDDRQKTVQAISDGGGRAVRVEAMLKHRNGSGIWISTNACVRCDAEGKVSYIEGVARDISARKIMEQKLELTSRIDGLTGVYNRQYFMEKCESAFNHVKRYKRECSVLIVDLDHFKSINDQYGHHAGDLALKAFADICKQEIRESDIFGRLGGEEFGLMLPETSATNAKILAERICKLTDEIEITIDHRTVRFTASIGLVALEDDITLDALLRRADLAMYQAKHGGRNRVVACVKPAIPE